MRDEGADDKTEQPMAKQLMALADWRTVLEWRLRFRALKKSSLIMEPAVRRWPDCWSLQYLNTIGDLLRTEVLCQ